MKRNYGLLVKLAILTAFYFLVVAAGAAFGEEYRCRVDSGVRMPGGWLDTSYNGRGTAVLRPCASGLALAREAQRLRQRAINRERADAFAWSVASFVDLGFRVIDAALTPSPPPPPANPANASAYAAGQSRALAEEAARQQSAAYAAGYYGTGGAVAAPLFPRRQVRSGAFTQYYD